jgi:Ketopantoate reductase PanE/ApbA C terminal
MACTVFKGHVFRRPARSRRDASPSMVRSLVPTAYWSFFGLFISACYPSFRSDHPQQRAPRTSPTQRAFTLGRTRAGRCLPKPPQAVNAENGRGSRGGELPKIMRTLVRECIAVGRSESAILDESLVDQIIENYRSSPPDAINSMHADHIAGRPLEIDARNGAVVRFGRQHGIPNAYKSIDGYLAGAGRQQNALTSVTASGTPPAFQRLREISSLNSLPTDSGSMVLAGPTA